MARAHALGYAALAITDECSVAGVVRAHPEAKKFGLKLLLGAEFALADGWQVGGAGAQPDGLGQSVRVHHRGAPRCAQGPVRVGWPGSDLACWADCEMLAAAAAKCYSFGSALRNLHKG